MGKKIQVLIQTLVEVDADQWEMAYGIEGVTSVRKDVKAQVRNLIENGSAPDAPVKVVR